MTNAALHPLSTVGIIGGGIMGEAMIGGLLSQHVLAPDQIIVSDVMQTRLDELSAQYHVRTTLRNQDVADAADTIVLSIKPQMLDKIMPALHEVMIGASKPRLVLSILAGVTLSALAEGTRSPHIVRAMPNTPARIGKGITVWTAAPSVDALQKDAARGILATFGQEIYVDEEHYLDMATALSGSGPAYVFLFMEALIDAGVHMGLPRRMAEQLVVQTVRGAAEYADFTKEHPATLRNQVTSPGGTSAEALYHLEKGGLRTVMARGVWAAYQRSLALGAGRKGVTPGKGRNPDKLNDDK